MRVRTGIKYDCVRERRLSFRTIFLSRFKNKKKQKTWEIRIFREIINFVGRRGKWQKRWLNERGREDGREKREGGALRCGNLLLLLLHASDR